MDGYLRICSDRWNLEILTFVSSLAHSLTLKRVGLSLYNTHQRHLCYFDTAARGFPFIFNDFLISIPLKHVFYRKCHGDCRSPADPNSLDLSTGLMLTLHQLTISMSCKEDFDMTFWQAWLLFGLTLLSSDILHGFIGPGSSTLFVAKQRGALVATIWGTGIVLGSAALFVALILIPTSVIKRLPNFGPRHQ